MLPSVAALCREHEPDVMEVYSAQAREDAAQAAREEAAAMATAAAGGAAAGAARGTSTPAAL